MIDSSRFEEVRIETSEALDRWLAAHHDRAEGVWLVTPLKGPGVTPLSRDAVLDALVAWGWTDGIRRKREVGWTMQLISPRRTLIYAKSYKDRAARLEAEGQMQPPGRASVAAAKAAGLWPVSDPVDALLVPDDLASALSTRACRPAYDALPPSYRRNVLRWIVGAKTPPTRAKRIGLFVDSVATGQRMRNF